MDDAKRCLSMHNVRTKAPTSSKDQPQSEFHIFSFSDLLRLPSSREKFPTITKLDYNSSLSRLEVMSELQKAHWHFLDHLRQEFGLGAIGEHDFWSSALYHLAMKGVDPFHAPSRYINEWEDWSRHCMVGGAAIVRQAPSGEWEVLMVKCYKSQLAELSSTWAGGKADPTDATLWETCVREVFEEIGLDLTNDRDKVVAVIENRRVFNAVIPLDYHDPRLANLTMKAFEIHEIVWSPVSLNIDEIRKPRAIEGRVTDDGIARTKENPKELRMPWDFQQSYRMLQGLQQRGVFSQKLDNVDEILDQDPKDWTKSQGRNNYGNRR